MNELLGAFGAHRRNVTATVAAWGLVAVVLMAATVVSQMLDGPDLRPLFNGGLCVVGPLVGAALVKHAHREEQRVLVGTSLALFLIGLTLSLGPVIADMPSGKGALFQLMTREPAAFISPAIAAILIGLTAKVVYEPSEGFKRARAAALGDARWLSMDEAAALFPPDGEVVVGERTRPDREPAGKKPFDPTDTSTWGRGGSAPLLTYKLNFDSTHMLFFAGSGGFKTTSTVVPTALRYSGSMVVLDPAREVGRRGSRVETQLRPFARTFDELNSIGSNSRQGPPPTTDGRPSIADCQENEPRTVPRWPRRTGATLIIAWLLLGEAAITSRGSALMLFIALAVAFGDGIS